jgi:hypothetical protein
VDPILTYNYVELPIERHILVGVPLIMETNLALGAFPVNKRVHDEVIVVVVEVIIPGRTQGIHGYN